MTPTTYHASMRLTLRWLVRAISFVLLLVLIAWLTGRIVSDRYLWSQFLLWMPTPVALVATLLGLLIAILGAGRFRFRSEAGGWAIILAPLLICFLHFEHRLLRQPTPNPTGVVIVHWNAWPDEREPSEAYFEPLEKFDADIYILTDAWHVPLQRKAIERFGFDVQLATSRPFTIISRIPIIEVSRVVASDEMYVTVLEFDTTDQLGRPLIVHAVDLPSDLKLVRWDVAASVRELLDDRQEPAADVMVGDFNVTPGASLRMLSEGMNHAFREGGHGWSGTFPRQWPVYQIDHVFVRQPFRATRYEIADPGISRHRLQRVWIDRADRD